MGVVKCLRGFDSIRETIVISILYSFNVKASNIYYGARHSTEEIK